MRWDDYERIWRDRHPGLRYYGRPHPLDSNLDESSISAIRHRSSTMDRGMQTDEWTGGYQWPRPNRGDRTFEEALSSVQVLMMTVEDTHAIHSSSNTDARLVTRRPKQLAPLQLECNTIVNTPKRRTKRKSTQISNIRSVSLSSWKRISHLDMEVSPSPSQPVQPNTFALSINVTIREQS